MNATTIVVRADAGPAIGTGHVRRCLTLAEVLRRRGAEVRFITRLHGEYGARLFKGYDFPILELSGADGPSSQDDAVGWARDAAETKAMLDRLVGRPDWLIVDHYGLDARWESELQSKVARLFAIDDLADRSHEVDLLLDPNLYERGESRYQGRIPRHCRALIGPRYAPLRDEFRRVRAATRVRSGRVRRVLVFFGGGPRAASCTLAAIRALREASADLAADIVFQAEARDQAGIAAAADKAGFAFHPVTNRMAELIAGADLALGAGGTSLWERCCLGLPTVTFALADNQSQQVRDAAAAGVVLAAESAPDDVARLAAWISGCIGDSARIALVSQRGMALVDGRGCERILRELGVLSVRVRLATQADARPMYSWRNDPAVRAASRSDARLERSAHDAWFAATLADPRKMLLVGEVDGRPVGVVRFDIDGPSAEVSIYLVAGSTGRGFGADLLRAGENQLAAARPDIVSLIAEVNAGNVASSALFLSSGYVRAGATYRKSVVR